MPNEYVPELNDKCTCSHTFELHGSKDGSCLASGCGCVEFEVCENHEYEDGCCLMCGEEQDPGEAIDRAMDAVEALYDPP